MATDPGSPGSNPVRLNNPNTTDWSVRTKWHGCVGVPVSQGDVVDINNPADPANSSHADYLKKDPRSDTGSANPRNPNSPNYDNSNPARNNKIS